MVNILVRGQTCSKGWSLDCSLQKRPIGREGVMEAQRNRGLCNLSKFAATTIIRRLTQSGEWEALDVKECVKRGRRWGVKLNYFSWYESHDRGFWSCDPPLYNCPPCDSLIHPLTALLQPLILQPHPSPPPLHATLIKLLISPPHCWTVSTTRTLDTTTCYCLIRLDNI